MTCRAILIRPSDEKTLSEAKITGENYGDCEKKITEWNKKKYKDGRYWKITTING